MSFRHTPVMVKEVLAHLDCAPGKIVADCTVGGAGHARAILDEILPGGLLIGIDQDHAAIRHAQEMLAPQASSVRLFHDNFIRLPQILSRLNISAIDGILADLGVSLFQIESSGRGFSFRADEPLDMRMNSDSDLTAEMIVNTFSQDRLESIFREYGEERWAKSIARNIVSIRKQRVIGSSQQLADIVRESMPARAVREMKIHPATRVFMAIRIAVNRELEVLDRFITDAVAALKPGGRVCILSFHSLEDRIVKNRFRQMAQPCTCPPDFPRCVCDRKPVIKVLTRKVVRPTDEEIRVNPMSRSTRLRAAEKLDG